MVLRLQKVMPGVQKNDCMEDEIMSAGLWVICIIGGAAGILSSLYLLFAMPAIIVWKFYRHLKYGISMND